MTAPLPRFVPSPMVDKRFIVTLLRDRYDPQEGKFTDTVTAIGPLGARKAAEDKWRDTYPSVVGLHVEEVVVDPEFHLIEDGGCGQKWSTHDNTDPQAKLPFGCLPELVARANAGDQ